MLRERLGRIFNREFYTAPKEVQDLLRMAEGKALWDGVDKRKSRRDRKIESQLHAIELLGNTGSELALKTLTKWYFPETEVKRYQHSFSVNEHVVSAWPGANVSSSYHDYSGGGHREHITYPNMPNPVRRRLGFTVDLSVFENTYDYDGLLASEEQYFPKEYVERRRTEHYATDPAHQTIRRAIASLQASLPKQ